MVRGFGVRPRECIVGQPEVIHGLCGSWQQLSTQLVSGHAIPMLSTASGTTVLTGARPCSRFGPCVWLVARYSPISASRFVRWFVSSLVGEGNAVAGDDPRLFCLIDTATTESRIPNVLIISASVSGTASGLFPRPARCGASASLRASGLRSPKEFQGARKHFSLKFFGPTAKSGPLAWERSPSLRVPRYTGQKGSKTCI